MTEDYWMNCFKELNHSDVEIRRKAIFKLGQSEDSHVFKILSSNFSDGHPAIRDALFQVFTSKKERRIAEIVADALHSAQLSVRSMAMEVLKEMGGQAVFPLKRLTKSANTEVRKVAVELLGDINGSQAADILFQMLDESDPDVLFAVIDSIGKHKDIRAVPQLLEFYEKYEQQRPVVLNALSKIFLHWERSIIRSELLDADPILTFSFVNSVQENGNASALNLIIHWLRQNEKDIGDELLKALAAILKNNPFIVLPSHMHKIVNDIRDKYSEELSPEIFLTCFSRIPSNDSLDILMEYYERDGFGETAENPLLDYILKFLPVFLSRYFKMPQDLRIKIMNLLVEKDAQVTDSELVRIYQSAKNRQEKELILKVAVKNQLPEMKQLLLTRLSNVKKSQISEILGHLRYYRDEHLWSLYLKYLQHPHEKVRENAISGFLAYPEKAADYLIDRMSDHNQDSLAFHLMLATLLPLRYADRFFTEWLREMDETKYFLLTSYIEQTRDTAYLPLIYKAISYKPALLRNFVSFVENTGLDKAIPNNLRFYWDKLDRKLQKQISQILDAITSSRKNTENSSAVEPDLVGVNIEEG